MKKIVNYFLKGLLVFAPVALTLFVLIWAFNGLDQIFRDLFRIEYRGLGILIGVAAIFLIGFLASNLIGRKLVMLVDRIFNKVPLVKMLYGAVKDLIEAFAGDKKKFDQPVIAKISENSQARVLGFITRQDLSILGMDDHVAVYVPQSYNFAGNLIIFPASYVTSLNIPASDAMTLIVSGGVAGQ